MNVTRSNEPNEMVESRNECVKDQSMKEPKKMQGMKEETGMVRRQSGEGKYMRRKDYGKKTPGHTKNMRRNDGE